MTVETNSKVLSQVEHCTFPGDYSPYETRGEHWFDHQAAQLAVDFFPKFLTHCKGAFAGKPMHLEPWQANIIATLFGWKRPDGLRRYRLCLAFVPRGNGKSTICAGIALLLLYLDDEPGADIFSAAGSRSQASAVFDVAKQCVLRNETLARRSKVYQNSIVHQHNGLLLGAYKAISAEAGYQHGGNPHGVIFDELHTQPNRDLWDVLQTGTIKRLQPLTVAITTAGFDRDKHSICFEQYSHACKVRDGIIDDSEFLPVIYESLPDEDWTDPAVWAKTNPGLGVSITASALATECKRAQQNPAYEATFRRLHLNQWAQSDSDVKWLPIAKWDAEIGDPIERRRQLIDQYKGQECWAGLDLSATTDLTAFVLVFKNGKRFTTIPWFWVPEEGARKRGLKDRVPYPLWVRQNFIEATPGNVVDYDVIRHRINELGKQFNIREIASDSWNAVQLRNQLMADSFNVTDFRQGFKSMTSPSKELEKLVMSGGLEHGNNPVLRWNASNVIATSDAAGNLKPDKAKSTDKIDGIVGLVMGLSGALTATTNVYNTRGLRYL